MNHRQAIRFLVVFLFVLCAAWLVFAQKTTTQPAPPTAVSRVPNLEVARQRVVAEVLKGDVRRRALFAHPALQPKGTAIASWRSDAQIVAKEDSWFFFVDDTPGANWEHPAHYVLVGKASGELTAVAAKTPPRVLHEMQPASPPAEREMVQIRRNIASLRPEILKRPITLAKHSKYAVLVSGGYQASSNYGRYWNDLTSIYKALKKKYSYTDSEIIVLYANERTRRTLISTVTAAMTSTTPPPRPI